MACNTDPRSQLNYPKTRAPADNFEIVPFKRKIVWKNAALYLISHALSLYLLYPAFFVISWPLFIYAVSMTLVIAQGVLMGAHRYYSHRSFKTSKVLQIVLLILQTATSQNCLWVWVRDHRQHHKYSDTDADPHNARNGFFFSHVGWLLSRKHPDVIAEGKKIDMSDLDSDPYVMFQKRHYKKLWVLFAIVMPLLFPVFVLKEDLLTSFLICNVLRIVVVLNLAWMVNSWAHFYGTKPFDKNILSVDCAYWVSFLTLGEAWHNYHHCFPWDYKASEFGTFFPLNVTTVVINVFEYLGMVWDLKEANPETIVSRAARTGDGTPIWTSSKPLNSYDTKHDNNRESSEADNLKEM